RVPGLLPPRPAVARARAAETAGTEAELRRIRELVPDPAGKGDADDEPADGEDERGAAGEALDADSVLRRDRVPLEQPPADVAERRTDEDDEQEDEAVVRPDGARLSVARHAGKRESDAERGRPDRSRERGGGDALEAVPLEPDPGRHDEPGEDDAEAR